MAYNDDYILELLVNSGRINSEQAQTVRAQAAANNRSAIDETVAEGLCARNDILYDMASDSGMEFLPEIHHIDPEAAKLLDPSHARRYRVIPLEQTHTGIRVAISDPLDFESIDALRHLLDMEIEPVVIPPDQIDAQIRANYGSTDEARRRPPLPIRRRGSHPRR
ncbi:MAG: hypothetical protein HC901_03270 [Bdellovibrionaceae bacterium]|nr:hypothetical protein [Pseudobdellovibrionaceae bacterium]